MSRILFVARESFLHHSTNPLDLAEVLAADGHDVTVAAPFSAEARAGNRDRGFHLNVMSLPDNSSNVGFWWRAVDVASRVRPDVIIGVNPVGFVAADLARGGGFARHAIYYGLELAPPSEHPRSFSIKCVAARARRADLVVATGPDRAEEMEGLFGLSTRPVSVENAALRSFDASNSDLRARLAAMGCNAKETVIYVGGVGPSLRLLEAAKASRLWRRDAALVLVAFGRNPRDDAELDRAVEESDGRTVWLPPVAGSREAVIRLAAGADAGLVLYDHRINPSKNVLLATPNKLYDYIAAGLPVIGSDTPGLKRFIQGQSLGVSCNPSEPADIANAVEQVLARREQLSTQVRSLFATRYNYSSQSVPVRQAIESWTQARAAA